MLFRIGMFLLLVLINPCFATPISDHSRMYVWRSDVSTGGKCLSRAFLFEKVRGEKLGNSDVVVDFGLGTFPVRKVLVSEFKLDSLAMQIRDSAGIERLSSCSTLQFVAEDSQGNQKRGLVRLDLLLSWISTTNQQTESEFKEWFVLPLMRCCKP